MGKCSWDKGLPFCCWGWQSMVRVGIMRVLLMGMFQRLWQHAWGFTNMKINGKKSSFPALHPEQKKYSMAGRKNPNADTRSALIPHCLTFPTHKEIRSSHHT